MGGQAPGITDDQVERFNHDGVVLLPGIIDMAWVDRLRAAIDRDIANPAPKYYAYEGKGSGKFHGNQDLWQSDADCRDYCLNSPLPAAAARLFGASKVNLFFDHLFVKEPGALSPTPWHNDQPYWPVRGWQVMSFWLALDPVTSGNGAVEYIRGSHRWDRWFQPRGFADSDNIHTKYAQNPDYEPIPDFDTERADHDILSYDMQPGDAIAFHALVVHGSGGNTSAEHRRRGYAVRYVGDDTTYDPRIGTSKLLWTEQLEPGQTFDSERFPVVWPRPG